VISLREQKSQSIEQTFVSSIFISLEIVFTPDI
jgi:hypothetical protein